MRDNSLKVEQSSDWTMTVDPAAPTHVEPADLDDERPFPSARGVLTKAEIEALLRPDLPDHIGTAVEPKQIEPRPPVQFEQEAPRAELTELHRSAGALAARLSLALGKSTGVKAAISLREVETLSTKVLPDLLIGKACAVACFGPSETEIATLVCLPDTLADALIAQACGARGSTGRIGDGWSLSAIDCALLEQLLGPLRSALGNEQNLQAIETDIPYVTSLMTAGDVRVADYGVEAPGLRSELAVISAETSASTRQTNVAPQRHRAPMIAVLTARIASLSVPLSSLTNLKAGSTLLLGLPADQPVEVLSGDRDGPVAFEGQVGRKGNRVAVKITRKTRTLSE